MALHEVTCAPPQPAWAGPGALAPALCSTRRVAPLCTGTSERKTVPARGCFCRGGGETEAGRPRHAEGERLRVDGPVTRRGMGTALNLTGLSSVHRGDPFSRRLAPSSGPCAKGSRLVCGSRWTWRAGLPLRAEAMGHRDVTQDSGDPGGSSLTHEPELQGLSGVTGAA